MSWSDPFPHHPKLSQKNASHFTKSACHVDVHTFIDLKIYNIYIIVHTHTHTQIYIRKEKKNPSENSICLKKKPNKIHSRCVYPVITYSRRQKSLLLP